MDIKKTIKKIENYLGIKLGNPDNGKYTFEYDDLVCSFREQGDEAHSFHVRRVNDHSCYLSDYMAGYFSKNATQFLHSIKRPDAKYPAGTLIRGKSNKRAIRNGIAEEVGVVVDIGNYGAYKILWNGTENVSTYVHERDLEKVE